MAADREASREDWEEFQKNPHNVPLTEEEQAHLVAFITEISIPRATELDLISVNANRFPDRDYPVDVSIPAGDVPMPNWVRDYLDNSPS